ncbi:MAG: hypothetical protein U0361_02695 [Nitrospiraceae bacterium]
MTLSNVRHALNRIPASVEQAAEDITELWVKVIRVVLSLLISPFLLR